MDSLPPSGDCWHVRRSFGVGGASGGRAVAGLAVSASTRRVVAADRALPSVLRFTEIAPEKLDGRDRRDRRGFGPHGPGAEARRREAGFVRLRRLVRLEPSFRADEQGDRRFRGRDRDERPAVLAGAKANRGAFAGSVVQPVRQGPGRLEGGDGASPALLAGAFRDAPPTRKPLLRLAGGRADDAARSLAAGRILPSVQPDTVADGLRTALAPLTFALLRAHGARILTVSEEQIVAAMRTIWMRLKLVVEPSAAAALAAVLAHGAQFRGRRVGVVLTGGNVDLERLPWTAPA